MLRYFIGAAAAHRFSPRFPVGTLSINLSACFLIGLILEYWQLHTGWNSAWRYFFVIGFIGAFSTFSTFAWETWSDMASGSFWIGLLYITVSVVGGLISVAVGSLAASLVA